MGPCDCVVVTGGGERKGQAGVVESVKKNKAGEVSAATVDMDSDHARVEFAAADLRVIRPHG